MQSGFSRQLSARPDFDFCFEIDPAKRWRDGDFVKQGSVVSQVANAPRRGGFLERPIHCAGEGDRASPDRNSDSMVGNEGIAVQCDPRRFGQALIRKECRGCGRRSACALCKLLGSQGGRRCGIHGKDRVLLPVIRRCASPLSPLRFGLGETPACSVRQGTKWARLSSPPCVRGVSALVPFSE